MAMFLKNHVCAFALLANIWLTHCAADDDCGMALHRDQEITQSMARAAYEQYESELRGKSQEELNALLGQVSSEPTFDRSKIIALVYAGADANFTKKYGYPILQYAIYKKDNQLIRFLLERKADPNQLAILDSPVFWLCTRISALEELVYFGADVTKINRRGENILHYLTIHPVESLTTDEHAIKFLMRVLQLGALVNQIRNDGYTPFMSLALNKDIYDSASAKLFKEQVYLYLSAGAETEHRVTRFGHEGKTAADILRGRAQGVHAKNVEKKTCSELARTIDRYPFRSLQELIIRNAILDARATDPLIAWPAQELVTQLKEPGTTLRAHNKKTFDRCLDELTPREETEPIAVSRHGGFMHGLGMLDPW